MNSIKEFDTTKSSNTIGLLIPVFNHSKYLDQCIRSAVEQTVPFDQIVIVNDNSTEPAVREILDKWARESDLVDVYHLAKNGGICACQNYGLSKLSTDYVAFLDCDDYLSTEANQSVSGVISSTCRDYYFTNRTHVDESGKTVSKYSPKHVLETYGKFSQCLLEHMVVSHFKIVRRSRLKKTGGFELGTEGVQDWVLAVQMLDEENWFYIDEFVYYHRLHSNQTTESNQSKHFLTVNRHRRKSLDRKGFKRLAIDKTRVRFIGRLLSRSFEFSNIEQAVLMFGEYGVRVYETSRDNEHSALWSKTEFIILYGKTWIEIGKLFFELKVNNVPMGLFTSYESQNTIQMARWFSAYLDFIIFDSPITEFEVVHFLDSEIETLRLWQATDPENIGKSDIRIFNDPDEID